jgi:hypothetical protein
MMRRCPQYTAMGVRRMSNDGGDWVNASIPAGTGHDGSNDSDVESAGDTVDPSASLRADDVVVAALRHDVHKLNARRHSAAREYEYGKPVNEQVPFGADQDAALLSRPDEDPEPAMQNYVSPYRLSLVTGEAAVETERIEAAAGGGFRRLVTPDDPELLHARWLSSQVSAAYNESPYYPYTSLKYHTLLVAALTDNYRAGHDFGDLYVAVSPGDEAAATQSPEAAMAAETVEPARTVLWTPGLTLHITAEPGDRAAAKLGPQPTRSFADVWSRLPTHPFDVDGERIWRVLDAQLRRVRAWSTALQYIEEYTSRIATQQRGDADA